MANIFYRIDDRLIHGQVITTWTKYYRLRKIFIVDDQVADDPIQRQIIKAVAPSELTIEILKVNEAPLLIQDAEAANQISLVLVKGPDTLIALKELGIDFTEIIVGGMQYKEGRKKITRTISASEEEAQDFKNLAQQGVELIVQQVPTDRRGKLMPEINRSFPKGG